MGLGMRLLLFECRSAPRIQLSSNAYGLFSFNAPSTMSSRILTNIENIYSLSEESVTDACRVRPLWPSATNRHFKYPPINNYNVHWVRTATRAAPCNKSEMTDNSYPSRKIGVSPYGAIFLSVLVIDDHTLDRMKQNCQPKSVHNSLWLEKSFLCYSKQHFSIRLLQEFRNFATEN